MASNPFFKRAIGFEDFGELRWQVDDEFTEIGSEPDEGAVACADAGSRPAFSCSQ